MTLKRLAYIGGSMVLMLLATSVLFLGNQSLVNADSLAEEINCSIYEQLVASGAPIPEDLAAACGSGGGADSDSDDDSNDPGNPPVDPCEDIFPRIPGMPECEGDEGDDENVVDACTNETTDPGAQESGPCNSDDVCPNDEGIQTTTPCASESDDDGAEETPPTPGGSGGGGSGGGGGIIGGGSYPGGQVLGTAVGGGSNACDYISGFIKPGRANDIEQVYRLQAFLKVFEGAGVEMSGIYDEASIAAVRAFQTKYAADILSPWGISQSTGYVYLTTRKKMNEIYCDGGLEFPLSQEEQQEIDEVKAAPVVQAMPARASEEMEHEDLDSMELEDETEVPVVDAPSRSVWDFFRGLFDRFR